VSLLLGAGAVDRYLLLTRRLAVNRPQNYGLRNRPHNRQLPGRISRITDCNFTVRMLYRNMYWLLYISDLRFVLFLCTTAVWQFAINKYVMLCYVKYLLCNPQYTAFKLRRPTFRPTLGLRWLRQHHQCIKDCALFKHLQLIGRICILPVQVHYSNVYSVTENAFKK